MMRQFAYRMTVVSAVVGCGVMRAAPPAGAVTPTVAAITVDAAVETGSSGMSGDEKGETVSAQLLVNGEFEAVGEKGVIPGWSLLKEGGGEATLTVDAEKPLGEKGGHSLRLEVGALPGEGGRLGAASDATMQVMADQWYDVTFYARKAAGGPPNGAGMGVIFSLESGDGKRVAARTTLPEVGRGGGRGPGGGGGGVAGNGWQAYTTALHARESLEKGRLVMSPVEVGTIWIDRLVVSPRGATAVVPVAVREALRRFEGTGVLKTTSTQGDLYAMTYVDKTTKGLLMLVFNTAGVSQAAPLQFENLKTADGWTMTTVPLVGAATLSNVPAPTVETRPLLYHENVPLSFPPRTLSLIRIPER